MKDALLAAGGAAAVAALNELRAQLRARQADRDRREALIAAALLLGDPRHSSPHGSPEERGDV